MSIANVSTLMNLPILKAFTKDFADNLLSSISASATGANTGAVLTDEQFAGLKALLARMMGEQLEAMKSRFVGSGSVQPTKPSRRKTGPHLVVSQRKVAEDTGLTVRAIQKWESSDSGGPLNYTRTTRSTLAGYNQWIALYRKGAAYSARHNGERTRTVAYKENVTELASTKKNEFNYAAIKD